MLIDVLHYQYFQLSNYSLREFISTLTFSLTLKERKELDPNITLATPPQHWFISRSRTSTHCITPVKVPGTINQAIAR